MKNISFWTLLPILFCMGILIMQLFGYNKSKQGMRRLKSEIRAYQNKGAKIPEYMPLNINVRELEKLIINNDIIQGFLLKLEELEIKLADLESNNTTHRNKIETILPIEGVKKEMVFYMTRPSDNYFHISAKTLIKENAVYKFSIKENPNKASFEIHTTAATIDKIVMQNNQLIQPVCIEENIPTAYVRNIITIKPGTATLEGDKWIINTKATIRYE